MARSRVRAPREIRRATLVRDPGRLDQIVEPAPIGEATRDGRIALDFGRLPAGQSLLVFMQFEVTRRTSAATSTTSSSTTAKRVSPASIAM
jgi:hypothetical protein